MLEIIVSVYADPLLAVEHSAPGDCRPCLDGRASRHYDDSEDLSEWWSVLSEFPEAVVDSSAVSVSLIARGLMGRPSLPGAASECGLLVLAVDAGRPVLHLDRTYTEDRVRRDEVGLIKAESWLDVDDPLIVHRRKAIENSSLASIEWGRETRQLVPTRIYVCHSRISCNPEDGLWRLRLELRQESIGPSSSPSPRDSIRSSAVRTEEGSP